MAGGGDSWWDGNPGAIYDGLFSDFRGVLDNDAGGMMGAPQKSPNLSMGQGFPSDPFSNVGSFTDNVNTNDNAIGGSWMDPFYSGNSEGGSAFSSDYLAGTPFDSATPIGYETGPGYADYSMSSADNRTALNASNAEYNAKPGTVEEDNLLKKYKNAVQPFQGLLKNPIISTLMGLHPGTAVLKTLLGGPTSVGGFLGSLVGSSPLGKIAGSLGGAQLANYATDGKFAPMSTGQIGGLAGSVLGGMTGNPYAQLAGGYLGSKASDQGQSWNPGDFGGPMGGGQGFTNLVGTGLNGTLGGTLANLGMSYNNNRALGNQISSLEGLYGQNSPYATAMREQLNRRDAASGRRSQYGPREVELQALLAGNAAKLQPGLQQLYGQKMGNTNLLVQSLMRNPKALEQGWDSLADLFKTQSSNPGVNWEPQIGGINFDQGQAGGLDDLTFGG